MSKFYYDIYTTFEQYIEADWISSSPNMQMPVYGSYTFDASTNTWATTGSSVTMPYDSYRNVYKVFDGGKRITRTQGNGGSGPFVGYEKSASNNTVVYSKGSLLQSNIISEEGIYPDNGRHTDGYWYVKGVKAFPDLFVNINGVNKESEDGWVNINGVWKQIDSVFVNVGGVWKNT